MQNMFSNTKKCIIDIAVNGQVAFEKVMENFNMEPQQFYDLVILDLHMPICDGFDACDKIFKLFNKPKMFGCSNYVFKIDERD